MFRACLLSQTGPGRRKLTMPVQIDSIDTTVSSMGDGLADAPLSEAELNRLAELIYQLILAELRTERERLGR